MAQDRIEERERGLRVLLVNMPWQSLDYPSLPVGILRAKSASCVRPPELAELYGNLAWAEYLLERSGGEITPLDYTKIADDGLFYGVGDWVFTPALYDVDEWKVAGYERYLAARRVDAGTAVAAHRLSRGFVEELAGRVAAGGYDVVGLTSTFMQNVPSLALARRLKQARPDVVTVMGGGNCDGVQGVALHRNFDFLDFVVCGEGERAYVALLDALQGTGDLGSIPGLCWRREGRQVVNGLSAAPVPIGEVPAPEYSAYFDAIEESPVREWVEPKVVLEAARGCWWGEKHQCTFCGLNGSTMKFRSKRPETVWDEIAEAVGRFRSLDVIMVDNILDMRYLRTLLPRIAASGWDLRIHYEIKSNLDRDQVEILKAGKIAHVQPGIESLSSRVLKLMDKGVTGPRNVQLLRDCEEQNLTVSWNYLYGFPEEEPGDYRGVIEQIPSLVHLQPPAGASRILLERFSPYFEQPELGFADRRPAAFYSYLYELPSSELENLVYLFDTDAVGIDGGLEADLQRALADWQDAYHASSLTYRLVRGRLHVRDRRANRAPQDLLLAEPREVAAYLALGRDLSAHGVRREVERADLGASDEWVESWLGEMKAAGLVFEDAGRFVALALRDDPRRVRLAA